jgi:hypothetical protein
MNLKNLRKIRQRLRELHLSPQGHKSGEFIAIATQLGRKLDPRGKEPNYVREREPALSPPLSIPNHGGKDLKTGTARNIIAILLDDVDDWEIYLQENEDEDVSDHES